MIQQLQGFLTGALSTAIVLHLHAPALAGLVGVLLQEIGRGIAAIAFGSLGASLGVLICEEALLYEGNPYRTLVRLGLLLFPHLALGLLWQRFKLYGGMVAIAEHLAWNQWFASPLGFVPVIGMGAIYYLLFLKKESI